MVRGEGGPGHRLDHGDRGGRRPPAVCRRGRAWWSTRSPAARRGSGWPPSWGRLSTSPADVADEEAAGRLVDEAVARFGRLDILVNNAGITRRIPLDDLEAVTAAVWREILDTNLVGAWNVTAAAAPHLRLSGEAAVVNLTSLVAHRFFGSSIPYAVSKAALAHLTQMLARVLGPEIRVNAVSPGFVATRWNEAPGRAAGLRRVPRPPAESGHARGDRRGGPAALPALLHHRRRCAGGRRDGIDLMKARAQWKQVGQTRRPGGAVVISGGASGMGLALARRLVAEGTPVGIFDIASDGVAAALEELRRWPRPGTRLLRRHRRRTRGGPRHDRGGGGFRGHRRGGGRRRGSPDGDPGPGSEPWRSGIACTG